ncbi:hypothetical protein GCM10027060_17070 [Nesterenkonia halophila]|uniref:TetR/AcrR family transcriptional regulator n=1 Tax=Nesterenkonia halophila TaxID=302044 RepID=UPI001B8717F3|nr:TetR/AcrR family transcriptional regulator [Nesterenkonia halophila]
MPHPTRELTTPRSEAPRPNRGPAAGPRNRAAIIDAARVEFRDHGARVPLTRIARRAGVGQGSLYRHFSDRTDLAVAVFSENVERLAAAVSASDTPYVTFMDGVIDEAVEAAVVIDLISQPEEIERTRALADRLQEIVVDVAVRDGRTLNPEVDVEDFINGIFMLSLALSRMLPEERRSRGGRMRRMLDAWFLGAPLTPP